MEALKRHCLIAKQAQLGYGGRPLSLKPLSFEIPEGVIATLIGPNGSGKSTLLRSIVGERFLLSGEITLQDGISTQAISPRKLSEQVAFIPQELIYPGHLSVRNTLRYAFLARAGWFGKNSRESERQVDAALVTFALVGLADKNLSQISSGERQRVFLARGFLQPAKLLVWDEPTNHLDPKGSEIFSEALLKAQSQHRRSLLLATHDERLVGKVANWVVAINKEGLVYSGPLAKSGPADIFKKVFGLTL